MRHTLCRTITDQDCLERRLYSVCCQKQSLLAAPSHQSCMHCMHSLQLTVAYIAKPLSPCTKASNHLSAVASAGCCIPLYQRRPRPDAVQLETASARSCTPSPTGACCRVKSQQLRGSSWWSCPHSAPSNQCAGIGSCLVFFLLASLQAFAQFPSACLLPACSRLFLFAYGSVFFWLVSDCQTSLACSPPSLFSFPPA